MKAPKNNGRAMLYSGFSILGGVLGVLYGTAANRFQPGEILLFMLGGLIAGAALALVCNGIVASLKK